MNNPYTWRGALSDPTLFEGRTAELNEIASFVRGNQSVSIVGPRKIGKSSLMLHLMRPATLQALNLGSDYLLVYVDCESLSASDGGEVFACLSTETATALRSRVLDPEVTLKAAATEHSRSAFEAAVRHLNERGLRLVFLLDEFEVLTTNPRLDVGLYNALRSAAGRLRLVFVTASARPLIELTYSDRSQAMLSSPFFNIFSPLFLGLLSEAESRHLIRAPMRAAGIQLAEGMENFVYALVGGHPLGIQIACYHAWDCPDKVEEVAARTKQELEAHFQYYWHHLSDAEREALREPGEAARRAAIEPAARGILRNLVRKCLLVQNRGEYSYPGAAWAEFISDQGREQANDDSVDQPTAMEPEDASRPNLKSVQVLDDAAIAHDSAGADSNPIRRLIRQSLPEMLGGLGAAAFLAIAGLIYTQLPGILDALKKANVHIGPAWLALGAVGTVGIIVAVIRASTGRRLGK